MKILENLLKIKSIWSLVAAGTFVYLVVTKGISGEIAMATITAVVTYYFTKNEDEEVKDEEVVDSTWYAQQKELEDDYRESFEGTLE